MSNTPISWFIGILLYLVALSFLLGAVSVDVPINYENDTSPSVLGNGFAFNIVTNIENSPIWFNTIFILIPVILLIVLAIIIGIHGG